MEAFTGNNTIFFRDFFVIDKNSVTVKYKTISNKDEKPGTISSVTAAPPITCRLSTTQTFRPLLAK